MRHKFFNRQLLASLAILVAGTVMFSCSDDNDATAEEETEDEGQYVIAAASSDASYLLQSSTVGEGEVSIVGNGVEAESATHWLFPQNKYAYGLQYNQASSGVVNSFVLDENNALTKRSIEMTMPRFTAFGTYEQYLLLGAAAATDQYADNDTEKANPKYGITFTIVDAEQQVQTQYTLVTENLTGNGEYYTLSGFQGINNRIYTSLIPVGTSAYGVAQGGASASANQDLISSSGTISGTLNPNAVSIAVFSGVDGFATTPTIVQDSRISYATGRYRSQYYPTVWLGDDNYLYVFSNSYAKSASDPRQQTTLPAGVIRLNTSTNQFDANYYFDIEAATGGYTFFNVYPIEGSNNKFLMRLYSEIGNFSSSTLSMGIFDASTGNFNFVTGLPSYDEFVVGDTSGDIGRFVYSEDGLAYITVTTADGNQPAVYVIDSSTATASKGITVVADGGISAIGKLYK